MTPLRGAAALLSFTVLLIACGAQNAEPTAVRLPNIPIDDLAVMVVPQAELGDLADGLRVSVDDSGPTTNLDAADDTLDPADSARSLKAAGRVAGYDLSYESPGGAEAERPMLVATTAELFRDPVYAAQYLSKQVSDYDRFEGKVVDGLRLVRVRNFAAVGVGEEAAGLLLTVAAGKVRFHATVVYFRRGRLVGVVWAATKDEKAVDGDVNTIAVALDERMQGVLAGTVDEEPVPLPGKPRRIDPKPFVLTAGDLPPGSTATGEGRRQHGDIASFLREFAPLDKQLGSSTVLYLRSMVQVFERSREAAAFLRAIESRKVALTLARTFVQGVVKSKVTRLRVLPLEVEGRDAAGAIFRFDLSGEPIETVFFYVWSGRLLGSVTALGPAGEIHSADVLALVPRVRARLNTGG